MVTEYLDEAGLLPYLEALGFHLVGYGCTTCIGNSGPLPDRIADAVKKDDLVVAAVLSGNRNFEGRINPLVRMNFLASPPLVVAYALPGDIDIDLVQRAARHDRNGDPVFLRDIWPTNEEVRRRSRTSVKPEQFAHQYANAFDGDDEWKKLEVPTGTTFVWDDDVDLRAQPAVLRRHRQDAGPPSPTSSGARVLARPRRLGHDRSHLARRQHREGRAPRRST